MSLYRSHLWERPYFSSSEQHVSLILQGWFVRWEVSGRTAAALYGDASRICSKQHIASLCISHLLFLSECFIRVQVVQPYRNTDTATASKAGPPKTIVVSASYMPTNTAIKKRFLKKRHKTTLCWKMKILIPFIDNVLVKLVSDVLTLIFIIFWFLIQSFSPFDFFDKKFWARIFFLHHCLKFWDYTFLLLGVAVA